MYKVVIHFHEREHLMPLKFFSVTASEIKELKEIFKFDYIEIYKPNAKTPIIEHYFDTDQSYKKLLIESLEKIEKENEENTINKRNNIK